MHDCAHVVHQGSMDAMDNLNVKTTHLYQSHLSLQFLLNPGVNYNITSSIKSFGVESSIITRNKSGKSHRFRSLNGQSLRSQDHIKSIITIINNRFGSRFVSDSQTSTYRYVRFTKRLFYADS